MMKPRTKSLRWYRAELVRSAERAVAEATTTTGRAMRMRALSRVRAMTTAEVHSAYISHRAREIMLAPLAELRGVVPTLRILRG